MARRFTRSQISQMSDDQLMDMYQSMRPVEDTIAPPAEQRGQEIQGQLQQNQQAFGQPVATGPEPLAEGETLEAPRPFIKPAAAVALDSTMAEAEPTRTVDTVVDAVARAKMDEVMRKNRAQMYGIPVSGKVDPKVMSDAQAQKANLQGIWQGVKELGQEALKIWTETGELLGTAPEGTRSALGAAIDAQRLEAEAEIPEEHKYQYNAGKFIGSEGLLLGVTAPLSAPVALGTKISSAVARILMAGGTGAAVGSLTPTQGSVTTNAKIGVGAAVGAGVATAIEATGIAGRGAVKLWHMGNRALGSKIVKDDIIREASGAVKQGTMRASKETGIPLDPAEASKSSVLMETRSKLGRSPASKEKLDKYSKLRDDKTKTAISDFLNKVSAKEIPNNLEDSVDDWAAKYIAKQKAAAVEKASPLYDMAAKARVPAEVDAKLMRNPVIKAAVVRSDDPEGIMAATLKDYPHDSLARWDAIKKFLDGKASSTNDRNSLRLYREATKEIRDAMDEIAPVITPKDTGKPISVYKYARQVAMEDFEDLKHLQTSTLGRLANMAETQKKRMSDVLFDPSARNAKTLGEVRDLMIDERPDLYYALVRQHIEKQLGAKTDVAVRAGDYGKAVQEALLGNANKRRILDVALYRNPEARKNALYITRVLKATEKMPRGTREFERDTLSVRAKRAIDGLLQKYTVHKFDSAVADVMLNPAWMDEIAKYRNMKPDSSYVQGKIAEMLEQSLSRQAAMGVVGISGE